MSVTRSIAAALAAALANADGTGSYTYDLSAAGAVVQARQVEAEQLPGACVYLLGYTRHQGLQMGYYGTTLRFGIDAFVLADGDALGDVEAAGSDLLSDVLRAIEADRSLGGLAIDLVSPSGFVAAPGAEDLGMVAAAHIEIHVDIEPETGV